MTPTPDTEAPVQDVPPNDTPATNTTPGTEPTTAPEQPPVDNAHVAEGATPFSAEDVAANAPVPVPAPLPEEDPAISTAAGAEPFTQADGTPLPTKPEGTPVLIASVCLYREPDGRFSLVREHVPQTFHVLAADLLSQAKQYLHQRMDAHGK